MGDEELEQIRQKKLAELQEQLQEQQQEQLRIQQQITQLENFVKQRLTKEALARFGNLKAAHPEFAVQVLVVLSQLIRAGKAESINDEMLKSVLQELQAEKHSTRIIRK
jgi:programmed cell death protein 5